MPKPDPAPEPTPEESARLDRLSEITAQDIEDARIAWRKDAPPGLWKDLLDAKSVDDGD